MKEIVKKGNVSKILVTRDGDTIVNIPLSVGVLGTVIAPWGMIASIVAAFGFKCKIELIKDDGSVIDITEKQATSMKTPKRRVPISMRISRRRLQAFTRIFGKRAERLSQRQRTRPRMPENG